MVRTIVVAVCCSLWPCRHWPRKTFLVWKCPWAYANLCRTLVGSGTIGQSSRHSGFASTQG